MPPPPSILDLGPARATIPPGYVENTRFVFSDESRRLVVSRFDDPAESPDAIAGEKHDAALDVTQGAAKVLVREPRALDERPAFLTVYEFTEKGRTQQFAALVLQLRHQRYALLRLSGRGVRPLIDPMLASVRVGTKVPGAVPAGFERVRDFVEFRMAVPKGLSRRTPYTFEDPGAGVSWRMDAARVVSKQFPELARRVPRPASLDTDPDATTSTFRGVKRSGPVTIGQTIDTEMAAPGPIVAFAVVTVEDAVQVRLSGQAPPDARARLEADLASIIGGIAVSPGGEDE
ncbi:MAG: hypothetical protein SFY69_08500 [Planctomycetota bacterium]|nr:hypothetical protein [Planctomycetota bacterium]